MVILVLVLFIAVSLLSDWKLNYQAQKKTQEKKYSKTTPGLNPEII
jgi:hypothetical protein